jgi:hypothetical protein
MQPFDRARHARERRRLLCARLALAATLAHTTPAIAKEPSADAATTLTPRPASTIEEVRINGVKKAEPTAPRDSMRGREIRQMPGAFGDAFRAIEALPGVTPIMSGLPYFFVRGAPPGNTGYFIDGVRVPVCSTSEWDRRSCTRRSSIASISSRARTR